MLPIMNQRKKFQMRFKKFDASEGGTCGTVTVHPASVSEGSSRQKRSQAPAEQVFLALDHRTSSKASSRVNVLISIQSQNPPQEFGGKRKHKNFQQKNKNR